jgi:hypothetical protein
MAETQESEAGVEVDLDSETRPLAPQSTKTAETIRNWYVEHVDTCRDERKTAYEARDNYDGIQYSAEEVADLEMRGQPIITANRIAPKINFLVGAEIASRVDPTCLSRSPNEDDGAAVMTDALRYAASRSYANFQRAKTDVMQSLLIEGVGGALIVPKSGEDFDLLPIPYDRLWWDPHSRDLLFKDALYTGVVTWRNVEEARQDYGDAFSENLERLVSSGDDSDHNDSPEVSFYDRDRGRIKIIEPFWQEDGVWWTAHLAAGTFLVEPSPLPYVTDKGERWCPLIMVRGNVTRETNASYGIVAGLVSLQYEVNKRRSKYLHLLMSERIISEEGAIQNSQEFRTERARPDGHVVVTQNALAEGRIIFQPGAEVAQGHMMMGQEAKSEIDQCGPSAPVLADNTSSMSGIALLRKKELVNTELRPIYDRINEWQYSMFCAFYWWIRQFWGADRWIRLTDDANMRGLRFVRLNQRMTKAERVQWLIQKGAPIQEALSQVVPEKFVLQQLVSQATEAAKASVIQALVQRGTDIERLRPEEQQAVQQQIMQVAQQFIIGSPLLSTEYIANDVSQIGIDIVIDTVQDLAVVQQEQFEMLADMASKGAFNPNATPWPVMKLLLMSSQLRDKKQLVEQLEEMYHPAQDPGQQQMAQAQSQLGMAQLQAQVKKLLAEVDKIKADTARTMAQIPTEQAQAHSVQAQTIAKTIEAGRASVPNNNPAPMEPERVRQ